MDNIKEVKSFSQSNIDQRSRNSEAREKYRYMNTSNRNGRGGYKRLTRSRYDWEDEDDYEDIKIRGEFRRFVIAVAIIGFSIGVKYIDTNLTNNLESRLISNIRTSSNFENDLHSKMVYFADIVGINISGIDKENTEEDNSEAIPNTEGTPDIEENVETTIDDTILDFEPVVNESQTEDFYIDESILNEVFEEEKK